MMTNENQIVQFSHAAGGGDFQDVPLTDALANVASGKWYECEECKYDDGIRTFHCLAPCDKCDNDD